MAEIRAMETQDVAPAEARAGTGAVSGVRKPALPDEHGPKELLANDEDYQKWPIRGS